MPTPPDSTALERFAADEEVVPGIESTRPNDVDNRRLVERVRPAGWANPQPAPHYDLVVVGAGIAGLAAAEEAAQAGAKVALVERGLLGGESLHSACVPSKALLASARHAASARRARSFGVLTGEVRVDFAAVMQRMRRVRARLADQDSVERYRQLGVDVFLGQATFVDRSTLQVEHHVLRFSRACVATGSTPAIPAIEGLERVPYLTSERLFSLDELPPRLAVLGAGPTGCEITQAFARFGAQVHLIERETHVLPEEDREASERMAATLREDGAALWLNSELARVWPATGVSGGVVLELAGGRRPERLHVDALLLATGRVPNVTGLGLDLAGVELDERGAIRVDDRLRTTNRRIYAAGDVCLPLKFTHSAAAAGRLLVQNALFLGRERLSRLLIPWCIYTEPEVAHVGLSRQEADAQGIPVDTFRADLTRVDRAVLDGDEHGFLLVHTARGKDTILGATAVAREAGGIIAELTAAMVAGAGLDELGDVIAPYPTEQEAVRRIVDDWRRARLVSRRRRSARGMWLGLRRLLHA